MSDKTILVVDDDEDIVSIVTTLLESEGYITISAFNGSDAFEKARVKKPDLIIADIMMPVMDGWELCWRVRQNDTLADTPFIFLTARADVMDQIRGSEIGADDYIIKPFRKQEFLKRIASTFEVIDLLSKVKTPANGPAGKAVAKKSRKAATSSTRKKAKAASSKKKKAARKASKKKGGKKKAAKKKKKTAKKKAAKKSGKKKAAKKKKKPAAKKKKKATRKKAAKKSKKKSKKKKGKRR